MELVKKLQSILGVTADGIIGPKTLSAIGDKLGLSYASIKDIQNKVGVTADGIIGPKTLNAILANLSEDKVIPTENKLVCISIGHSIKDQGAWSSNNKVGEYSYNKELAYIIRDELKALGISSVITNRLTDGGGTGVSADIKAINATGASVCVELHANAFNGKATGTETLYWHSDNNGKCLANYVQDECLKALGLTNRGVKGINGSNRGGGILHRSNPTTIITEPFFIDNSEDLSSALNNKNKLGEGIAKAIKKYID